MQLKVDLFYSVHSSGSCWKSQSPFKQTVTSRPSLSSIKIPYELPLKNKSSLNLKCTVLQIHGPVYTRYTRVLVFCLINIRLLLEHTEIPETKRDCVLAERKNWINTQDRKKSCLQKSIWRWPDVLYINYINCDVAGLILDRDRYWISFPFRHSCCIVIH